MKRDAGSRDKGWNRGHPRKERGHRAIREGNKTMSRVYNFSAGPAVLPEQVLKEAAAEMLDYNGTGMSVMEMSHRSKAFEEIIQTAEQDIRDLLKIPDNYKVLFLQGGAHQQFAAVPLNLFKNRVGDYIITGQWAKKAWKEAKLYGTANAIASSEDKTFSYIPDCSDLPVDENADYVYICENNTIYGTKFHTLPNTKGKTLVSDVSSCFLSEPMDVSKYGVIYGGVQKNIGPAGVVIVIIREDLIREDVLPETPTIMRYDVQAKAGSLYNTPPCYGIYICGKVFKWLKKQGGLEAMKEKNERKASVALKYNDIIAMKRAERSALVKGMDVVYIYHDTIDEASHTSDTAVFAACNKAISELKNLVRIIVNEFGGTNILITADHGFLYTYSPLSEDDKVGKNEFYDADKKNTSDLKKESARRCVEYGRRYAIMKKGVQPNYLLPVKFLDGNTEFDGFAPRESIRIKMNGGGMNFVHGGISLQEMVVPVIEYHYLRNDSMEYKRNKQKYDTKPVTVNLLSANRKISNMIFSLNFYQKDAVSANREAATYQVYFTDENGKQISDVQKIIADKTSDNGAERTFRCQFNLKSLKYSNTATYYLVIADEQGLQMPQREPFQIDIAFAVDEFDFFS